MRFSPATARGKADGRNQLNVNMLHRPQCGEQCIQLVVIEVGQLALLELHRLHRGQRVRVVDLLELDQHVEHGPEVAEFVVQRLAADAGFQTLGPIFSEFHRRELVPNRVAQTLDHSTYEQFTSGVITKAVAVQDAPAWQ
ncbi:hypothetical protein D9M68_528170 [compost metagenome]